MNELRKQVEELKGKHTQQEIADQLGISLSYVKKISAGLERKETQVEQALKLLRENPSLSMAELTQMEISETTIKNLNKNPVWKSEILPNRILFRIETGSMSLSDLKKINKDTLTALEQNPVFQNWFDIQTEIQSFQDGLKELQNRLKTEPYYIATCIGPYDLKGKLIELEAYRKEIPEEYRIGRSKQRALPLYVDTEYVKTAHNIRVLGSRIDSGQAIAVRNYVKGFLSEAKHQETKDFIVKMMKLSSFGCRGGKEEDIKNKRWIDADVFFAAGELDDFKGAPAAGEKPEKMYKHRSRGGSSLAAQRMAYAIGIIS